MLTEYEFKDRVMGTDFIVSLVSADKEEALGGFKQALGIARAYENRFSRFLEKSELSQLNDKKDLVVSEIFWQVFSVAENLHRETKKIFNPLLQISSLGYNKDFARMDKDIKSRADTPEYSADWDLISVDENDKRICMASDQKLDFGGFLKGYVAEDIVNILKYDFPGVIVNIGGDIYTSGSDESGKTFIFSIFNPITGREFDNILVKDEAIATSGVYKRKWNLEGKEVFHILDSASLENPRTDLVSATVIAPHGHVAEAYATVCICLGAEKAETLLDEKGFRYILIAGDGRVLKNI